MKDASFTVRALMPIVYHLSVEKEANDLKGLLESLGYINITVEKGEESE